ncbi:MAG: hypothetical protein A2049_03010 [Elusimicrobia bacterium GWA2_62_23]|nr:MAG: hypothetical protein A2049_03010 [Elusimicrobia bacterium GWA2_62_23]OGR68587.1 MAG: hypothetical protein A2179_03175 [Elusimicrobia bacterium GWC2_63_65]
MKHKILIVDDEENILFVTKTAFEQHYEVFTAPDGDVALEIIKREKPLLVFLDIKMPGKSGMEVLEAIGNMSVPPLVWMLTGDEDLDTALKTLSIGASGYVTKPFDLARLREIVLGAVEAADSAGGKPSARPWKVKKKKE